MKTKLNHNPAIAIAGLALGLVTSLGGCSSMGPTKEKVILERSYSNDTVPKWVLGPKAYEDAEAYYFRGSQGIRGNERMSGCLELAKVDARETLLLEVRANIRAEIDRAGTGLSEESEIFLKQSTSLDASGTITGLRINDDYYERYLVNDVERAQCFVQARITKANLRRTQDAILNGMVDRDPELRNALNKKQKRFFSSSETTTIVQEPVRVTRETQIETVNVTAQTKEKSQ